MGHKDFNARPLGAEPECLLKLLGTNDPPNNPQGCAPGKRSTPRGIQVPEGTRATVLLFAPCNTTVEEPTL